MTSAKLERYAVELQRIGLERNAPWSQMGFGTCFMHLSRSNLSGRPHLHQPFLCSRLGGNNLFERFHLHPCTSHIFYREAPFYLHFSLLCFLDNYRVGRKILNRLWFANSGWIFHKNFSTKLDWYLGAIFYLRDYPLQIYMKLVAFCFCLWLHHPPPTNIYSCGGYWYIPLAYLLATISNNIRDYKYIYIVVFFNINIRDYKYTLIVILFNINIRDYKYTIIVIFININIRTKLIHLYCGQERFLVCCHSLK